MSEGVLERGKRLLKEQQINDELAVQTRQQDHILLEKEAELKRKIGELEHQVAIAKPFPVGIIDSKAIVDSIRDVSMLYDETLKTIVKRIENLASYESKDHLTLQKEVVALDEKLLGVGKLLVLLQQIVAFIDRLGENVELEREVLLKLKAKLG